MIVFFRTILITYILLVLIPFTTSITFNLTNIGPQNREIVTEGDGAYISDGGIQLTPNKSRGGRATYFEPLHLWDAKSGELASFSSNFTFVIDSNGAKRYGDGLTFFLAQNNSEINIGESLGLPDIGKTINTTTKFVAVEFDTFWNRYFDPLMDSNSQPMGDHVGINIGSLKSVKSLKWLSNVPGGGVCQAWIKYDSVSHNLSVSFNGFVKNNVVRQDGLHYTTDLRQVLPEWVIFGFSAATGLRVEQHIVRSWSFTSSDLKFNSKQPPNQSSPDIGNGKHSKVRLIVGKVRLIVGLSVSIFVLSVLAFVLWKWKKKKCRKDEVEEIGLEAEMNKEFEMGTGPKRFSYQELRRATCDFAEKEKLGEGGFGGVYRGFLKESSKYVAVKRVSKSSKQGIKEYASEVKIISQLRHRNLVKLFGWCHEKRELLLVYEYMENGSLDAHLFKVKSLLTWGTRYKIAQGLASSLLYLHEEWEQCILHRDIKSSNVMLDSNFNAKLGDFGLAKLVDHEKGLHTTNLAGTLGYIAPECMVSGKASKESDVFSFGVVALEIACGRRSIEYKAQEKQIRLIEWVWELYGTGMLLEAVDPHLGMNFDEQEINRLMIVGLWCVHPDSQHRPSMRQAIQVLNCEASLPTLSSKMPVASHLAPPILSDVQYQSSSSASNGDLTASSYVYGR